MLQWKLITIEFNIIFSIYTLIVALSLSLVSAYYSVLGLISIFSAAAIPVAIMGITLELSKITTTVWLHYYWEEAPKRIKIYLTSAVVCLMLLTSLGTFGFLSKAHLDQAVPSGDVQSQVALFDEKIKTQRDNIDSYRKALTQMDAAVDQIMSRTSDENGATKAANLRRSQAKERTKLQGDIDVAQKTIASLQEERTPVASQLRKVEAEVGPIKYIAAMIYGDTTDQSMLEAAVRWVIIAIVFVFDPLAVVLILAATTSMDWAREAKRLRDLERAAQSKSNSNIDELQRVHEEEKEALRDTIRMLTGELDRTKELLDNRSSEWSEKEGNIQQIRDSLNEITTHVDGLNETIFSLQDAYRIVTENYDVTHTDLRTMIEEYDGLIERFNEIKEEHESLMRMLGDIAEDIEASKTTVVNELTVDPDPEVIVEPEVIIEHVPEVITEQEARFPVKPDVVLPQLIESETSFRFGPTLPSGSEKVGDLFLIDTTPSKLHKWVGTKWIEVDKESNLSYLSNDEYLNHLIAKIDSGEVDVDELTEYEQEGIAHLLQGERNGK